MDLAIYKEFGVSLAELEDDCNFLPDASNDDGYEKSKRIYLDNRAVYKRIDDAHKEAKKPHLEAGRLVDAAKKEIRGKVEAILEPHKIAYQAIDNLEKVKEQETLDAAVKVVAEQRRKAAYDEAVYDIKSAVDDVILDCDYVSGHLIMSKILNGKIRNIQFTG
jgi:hypothetical protein